MNLKNGGTCVSLARHECNAHILVKDIHSDYWKALVISLITAGGVIKLEEV